MTSSSGLAKVLTSPFCSPACSARPTVTGEWAKVPKRRPLLPWNGFRSGLGSSVRLVVALLRSHCTPRLAAMVVVISDIRTLIRTCRRGRSRRRARTRACFTSPAGPARTRSCFLNAREVLLSIRGPVPSPCGKPGMMGIPVTGPPLKPPPEPFMAFGSDGAKALADLGAGPAWMSRVGARTAGPAWIFSFGKVADSTWARLSAFRCRQRNTVSTGLASLGWAAARVSSAGKPTVQAPSSAFFAARPWALQSAFTICSKVPPR